VAQAGGSIAAGNLTVVAAGDVDLCQAPNTVTGIFAAQNTAAGAFVRFLNTVGITVDTVSADACAVGADGVDTNNGDVSLRTTGGTITLNRPVDTSPAAGANGATVRLDATGTVSQIAAGPITAAALAVRSTGGNILLDQANLITTTGAPVAGRFAAAAPTGNINFRNTSGLILDTVLGDPCVTQVAGVSTGANGTVRIQTAGGLTQVPVAAGVAPGAITTGTFGARNITTGDISLLATVYSPAPAVGNQVGTFAANNSAPGGRVDLAVLGTLSIGTVTADGTFAQVRGITTTNGGSNLRTGTNFTADVTTLGPGDPGFTVPLIQLGNGNFLLNPGQSGDSLVIFNAEAQTTGTFRLGVPTGAEAPPPPPPLTVPDQDPVPANPNGAATVPPAPDNPNRDTFRVRPSANVQILINGNTPTVAPGDTLNLLLTDLAPGVQIQFTPGGVGAGRFDFFGGPPGTNRKAVPFSGIEQVAGLSVFADAVQTGAGRYDIVAVGSINGRPLVGRITGGQAPANPFIVSPSPVNPFQPFGPARITFGDFNGDGTADLIVANGPANNGPLVTVFDGGTIFQGDVDLSQVPVISQFFAYDPQFQGGIFVAAGDLNGDGRVEIVTGPDIGGGPHVKVFTLNTANPNVNTNVVEFGTLFPTPFPVGGFFAYDANFAGGVRVAVGDVNGDGFGDIITGAGPGGGPHVKVFSGAPGGGLIRSFFAYDPGFRGGVYVTAGDYDRVANGVVPGRFTADIVTGAGAGGGPHVRVFSGGPGGLLTEFYAFGPDGSQSIFGADLGVTTGVASVGLADVDGDGLLDLLVTSARGPRTRLAAFRNLGPVVQRFNFGSITGFVAPPPFTLDPATGDLLAPLLRDGSNVSGLFGG
jgi:hypothetical protein